MPPYLKLGKDGHFRAQRAVPRHLRTIVGLTVWQRHIGKASRAAAARIALEFAAEKGQLIGRLESLNQAERDSIAAAGGLDPWLRQTAVDAKALTLTERLLPYIRPDAMGVPFGTEYPDATDSAFKAGDPDYIPAESLIDDLKFAAAAQTRIERTRAKFATTARKLSGDNSGTLAGLVDLWKKVRAPRNPATEASARRALKHFITICGDVAPRNVTPDHARKFRDRLDKDGHSYATITKWLYRMHAVFAVAVAEGKTNSNPFYKIKAHGRSNGKASDRRMPFSRDQIKLILSRCHELRPDERIVTQLMVYHGARPSELCQLRCVDVLEVDGIPALQITDEGEDGTLKNAESYRTIPIHPACVQEILTHVEACRSRRKEMLFDYQFVPSKGTRSHRFSRRFNTWLRDKLNIDDKRLVAYSTRHSFKDACRRANMPEYIANQLMGHRLAKGDAGGYGIGVSVPDLAKWLERIAY